MKRCAQCGRAYSDLVTICTYCGSALSGNAGTTPAPKPPVQQVVPFCPAAEYTAPVLTAGGLTAMNEAIITGLDYIELRKQEYKDVGVDYWRPWVFLLTDGVPTDNDLYQDAQQRLQEALKAKKINFFPMGIGAGADIQTLKNYTRDGSGMVLKASKENFQEAFVWLSSSMSVINRAYDVAHHDEEELYRYGHYVLTADISLNDTADFDTWQDTPPAYAWEPIGCKGAQGLMHEFCGVFDGQGHTISGLYLPGGVHTEGGGLFGKVGAHSASVWHSFFAANAPKDSQYTFIPLVSWIWPAG